MFFQAVLGGYLYAYLTSRWLKVRQQALLYILIFWGIFWAMSSNRVPLHLLTKEAFMLYKGKLREHGLLVFHISNRYLDLEVVLANLIADAGMVGLIRRDMNANQEDSRV